jgi:AcrR family transcriptional regulator
MTTLKEKQFQLRESAIVEAMYQLLVQKGYAATSIDDVATQVGISKATLYLHFKSKTELTLKVIIRTMEESEARIRSLDPSVPPLERIKRGLYAGIKGRATIGSAQIEQLPQEVYDDPAFQSAEHKLTETSIALIEQAQLQGEIRTDLSAGLIQEFVAAIFDMDFERLTREGFSLEMLSEQITDLMLRAIRP